MSAGFTHSAVVTADGELLTWGVNKMGCLGQPPEMIFLPVPTGVRCIYEKPKNLALGKPAKQSSVYGGLDAYLGVDGNTNGSDARYCVSTQQDPQAWWEVDLGDFAVLERIRVFNRVDEPPDVSQPRDQFSKRLFPSWIMCSQEPYPDDIGGDSLQRCLDQSVARMKLTKDMKMSTWSVPENINARYVT